MSRRWLALSLASLLLAACADSGPAAADAMPRPPAPRLDPAPPHPGDQVAVFAGGCFWGVEAVFDHVKGVRDASSGYAGGAAATATYERVSEGDTGHAESVQVTYDPRQVSYGQLLQVFFTVAHDPTEVDRQGPDVGSQYRSAVFYTTAQQAQVVRAYIAQLTAARAFEAPIATEVAPLDRFYPAEAYHQDFAEQHPDNPYIVRNDAPKVAHLKAWLPALYRPRAQFVEVRLR